MRRGLGLALGCLLLAGSATGCTLASPPTADPSGEPSATEDPAAVLEGEVTDLLARRARAIRAGRRTDFVATTAPGRGRRDQLEVYDALRDLPVATASYVISSVSREEGTRTARVGVLQLVKLAGFDPRPVAASHVLHLVERRGAWRVQRDTLSPSGLVASPWELPGARVRVGDGATVVVDPRSAGQADRLLRLFAEARGATREYVPYPPPRDVLVLAPSTVRPLRDAGFQPIEIARTGGLVIGVGDRSGNRVSDRMVLVPVTLRRDDDDLLNLLRHELAHLAIGSRDRDLPYWVVEGLAEWASWRGDGSFSIATSAVDAAEEGAGITRMPGDLAFRSPESGTSYGVAWFAMKVLENEHGPRAPYTFLDRLRARDAEDPQEVSRVLDQQYGLTSDQLAARAGDLIAETFLG